MAIERLTLRLGKDTHSEGHLWAGETKHLVIPVSRLDLKASARYTLRETGARETHALTMPREFGHSDKVTLEALIEEAAELESQAVSVRNPAAAAELRRKLRGVVLEMLAHPLTDSDLAQAVLDRLKDSMDRLQELERYYDEEAATMHRKRSLQTSHNLRSRERVLFLRGGACV